jgi:hypothetical protein
MSESQTRLCWKCGNVIGGQQPCFQGRHGQKGYVCLPCFPDDKKDQAILDLFRKQRDATDREREATAKAEAATAKAEAATAKAEAATAMAEAATAMAQAATAKAEAATKREVETRERLQRQWVTLFDMSKSHSDRMFHKKRIADAAQENLQEQIEELKKRTRSSGRTNRAAGGAASGGV